MPDQNSAAREHALMQEVTAPLESLPDDPLPHTANVDFPIVLRGYDRIAVDAYVKKTSQLVAELQATRSPDSAVRRAIERVGEEVSGVLQRAHETAEEITSQSRREAEERLDAARREAAQLVASAQQRLRDLDTETDRIWAERDRIVEDARQLAGQLTALASEAAARFAEEEEPSPRMDLAGEADVEPTVGAGSGGIAERDEAADRAELVEADELTEAQHGQAQAPPEPGRAEGAIPGRRTIVISEHPEDFPSGTPLPEPEDELSQTNVMPKADPPPQS